MVKQVLKSWLEYFDCNFYCDKQTDLDFPNQDLLIFSSINNHSYAGHNPVRINTAIQVMQGKKENRNWI